MKIRIKSSGKLTITTFHRRSADRQQFWWLRQVDGGFIEVPEVRGDCYFDLELDLEEGSYTLGAGPRGQHGIRELKEVSATKTIHICPMCGRDGTDKDFRKDGWGRRSLCNTCKSHL